MTKRPKAECTKYGVVHGLASCRDCNWETSSYKNAQALAAQHATRFGHVVGGELGIAFEYAPALGVKYD